MTALCSPSDELMTAVNFIQKLAKNFRAFAADYTLGEEFDGARLREFCESFLVTPVVLELFLLFSAHSICLRSEKPCS